MHSRRNITCEWCVSQPVLYEVLKMLSVMMCLKENVYLMEKSEIVFYLAFEKDTEKVVLLN